MQGHGIEAEPKRRFLHTVLNVVGNRSEFASVFNGGFYAVGQRKRLIFNVANRTTLSAISPTSNHYNGIPEVLVPAAPDDCAA